MSDTSPFANNEQQAMGVDQFVSDEALKQFEQRRADVRETADYYGLDAENALLIGGAALAVHGIDTHAAMAGEEAFDLDVLAVQDARYRQGIRAALRKLVVPEIQVYSDEKAPLKLTVLRGTQANRFGTILHYPDFETMVHSRSVAGNLATIPLPKLVGEKVAAGRPKDYAGLIKAHVVADSLRSPIVTTPYWNLAVSKAMQGLKQAPESQVRQRPQWLDELVESDFDHPAYRRIPRSHTK